MSEITIRENLYAIVKKSGMVYWVKEETGKALQQSLVNQESHGFIRIKELNITFNSSELDGVYDKQQYEDMMRAKNGEWQCPHRKWHKKNSGCDCSSEIWKRHEQDRINTERQEEIDRKNDPENQERVRKALKENRKILEKKGLLTKQIKIDD